jgi:hypothetical protein
MKTLKKKVLGLVAIVMLSVFWFYPRGYTTCRGGNACYGVVWKSSEDRLVLNAKLSQLEIRKEPRYRCLGYNKIAWVMFDACNGDTGWFTWRDVNCSSILSRCRTGSDSVLGITCGEWKRACAAISEREAVPVKITNYFETGIAFSCDSFTNSSFPGGEEALEQFINTHFEFPDSVKGKEIDATVAMRFSVDTTGHVSDIHLGEPKLHPYYQTEFARIGELMPLWSIAYCDQRKVRSIHDYTLEFSSSALGSQIALTAIH